MLARIEYFFFGVVVTLVFAVSTNLGPKAAKTVEEWEDVGKEFLRQCGVHFSTKEAGPRPEQVRQILRQRNLVGQYLPDPESLK